MKRIYRVNFAKIEKKKVFKCESASKKIKEWQYEKEQMRTPNCRFYGIVGTDCLDSDKADKSLELLFYWTRPHHPINREFGVSPSFRVSEKERETKADQGWSRPNSE